MQTAGHPAYLHKKRGSQAQALFLPGRQRLALLYAPPEPSLQQRSSIYAQPCSQGIGPLSNLERLNPLQRRLALAFGCTCEKPRLRP